MGAEDIIAYLSSVDLTIVYIAVFVIAYIENIFPPFPSDVIVVFAGSLIAFGEGNIALTLLLATSGSIIGFVTMYWIGGRVGNEILEKGRFKFIPVEAVRKAERWFDKYGYAVIIANRFLAGTRAVVAFCAGIAKMKLLPTVLLSAVSALAWNSILVYLGIQVGENWRIIAEYLTTYSTVISIILLTIVLLIVLRTWLRSRKRNRKTNP